MNSPFDNHLLTAAFKAFPALNAEILDALICISLPVCGLRPERAALSRTSKVPKPINVTGSPLASESDMVLIIAANARPASALVKLDLSAIATISSDLFPFENYCFYLIL